MRTGMIISCMPAFDIDLYLLFRNDTPLFWAGPRMQTHFPPGRHLYPLLYLLWYTCRSGVSVDVIYSIIRKAVEFENLNARK